MFRTFLQVLTINGILAGWFLGPISATQKTDNKSTERIVFFLVTGNNDIDIRLTALTLHNSNLHKLTDPDPLLNRIIQELVVSRDGKTAAYLADGKGPPEGGRVTYSIHVRPVDDRKAKSQSLDVLAHGVAAWSPDGKELLYWHYEDAKTASYYFVDVATGKKRRLALPKLDQPADASNPPVYTVSDWSPDGQWLLMNDSYQDKSNQPHEHIYLVKRDGAEVRRLQHIDYGFGAKFSPDGKRVLFLGRHRQDGQKLLQTYVADVAGGRPLRVSNELNGQVSPTWCNYCWSPNGMRVAYVWHNGQEAEDGEAFLMVVDADGRNAQVLFSHKSQWPFSIGMPNWR